MDQIVVTNPRTKKTERSAVLKLHQLPNMTVSIVPGSGGPANQLRLQASIDDWVADPETVDMIWTVIAGSGHVDRKTGVFTIDAMGAHKFAVITVQIPDEQGRASDDGYIILPIPLYTVPEALRMLTTDQMALSAN
ncbi:hypothetical protein LZV00_05270 [Pseudomonas kielensis]|uniref:hypothetical protein n=1 Tax=Pseudomonas kielensis TaxID=2762577 RepID=UPI002240879D|nr:hypothetical protein [Pseudomonas kielensis]UZM15186.1 hypothetical protein LZV00_05270 [Pseudomonas kielensis]